MSKMEGVLSHQIPRLSFYIICRYFRHERNFHFKPLQSEILATEVLNLKSYDMKYANSNLTGLARFSAGTTSAPGLFPKKIGRALGRGTKRPLSIIIHAFNKSGRHLEFFNL